ncbi:MAG: hypothetical protein GVY09_19995 [Gammaproteobacteria bacterium]|jgi:hypothetical protein|nr:hypothetical protein [Gammaproteobacteria bacterium]
MSTPAPSELIFVYNADSGLFNTMADAAHKVFAPETYSCNLCQVTYGWLTERRAWRDFIAALDVPCTFLHRDEMRRRWPDLSVALPAVLRSADDAPEVCITAAALNQCENVDDLIGLIRDSCLDRP